MACNSCNSCNYKNPYSKSCLRVYSNTAQSVTTTTNIILGTNYCTNTGCSINYTLGGTDITFNTKGLYHISFDMYGTAGAAGTITIQLLNNGVALPCAISSRTVVAGSVYAYHIETDLVLTPTCCNVANPDLSVQISGGAFVINHTSLGVLKEA